MTRRTMAMAALGCLLTNATPSHADDQYKACIEGTLSNTEWAQCGQEWIEREEARMDVAWGRLLETTEGNTKDSLENEQQAWTAFREAACEVYADQEAFGREGQVLSYPGCIAETLRARTDQLRAYLREIDP